MTCWHKKNAVYYYIFSFIWYKQYYSTVAQVFGKNAGSTIHWFGDVGTEVADKVVGLFQRIILVIELLVGASDAPWVVNDTWSSQSSSWVSLCRVDHCNTHCNAATLISPSTTGILTSVCDSHAVVYEETVTGNS